MAKLGQNIGNKNAVKTGGKRIDVHLSVADQRRAKMERLLREQGKEPSEEAIKAAVRDYVNAWIDSLPL